MKIYQSMRPETKKCSMYVAIEIVDGWEWRPVAPSGVTVNPYVYDNANDAARMLNMCYPDQCCDTVKVDVAGLGNHPVSRL